LRPLKLRAARHPSDHAGAPSGQVGPAAGRRSAQPQKQQVRPFKLHGTRHTYASLALAVGKSVRWVAEQLGHSNPELTLRTYAHVLRHEETDLSFADFGALANGAGRQQTTIGSR
jgi:integrase